MDNGNNKMMNDMSFQDIYTYIYLFNNNENLKENNTNNNAPK